MKLFVMLLLLFGSLFARELKKDYFVDSNQINLSTITGDFKNDKVIFSIQRNRNVLTVSSKKLLKILKQNGYHDFKAISKSVTFVKKSSMNLDALKKALIRIYEAEYPNIHVQDVAIVPRYTLKSIPNNFTINIKPSALLRSHATFSITVDNREIFFDYFIDANLPIYKSKRKIKRGEALGVANLNYNFIHFDKFKAKPIKHYEGYEAKYNIPKKRVITTREVKKIDLVKRGDKVKVILHSGGMELVFNAKALRDGSLNDTIRVVNDQGKKFEATIISKGVVEIKDELF